MWTGDQVCEAHLCIIFFGRSFTFPPPIRHPCSAVHGPRHYGARFGPQTAPPHLPPRAMSAARDGIPAVVVPASPARASPSQGRGDGAAGAAAAAEAALLAAQRSDPPVWRDKLDDLLRGEDDANDTETEWEWEVALPPREADDSPKIKKTKVDREAEGAGATTFAAPTAHTDGAVFEERPLESGARIDFDPSLPKSKPNPQETEKTPSQPPTKVK